MIDWHRVIGLRDELGPDELGPIIDMILAKIEAHLLALDGRTLHPTQDLHLLRGLASDIGFTELRAHCLRAGRLAQGDQGIPSLRASFGHTKQLFLRDLPHVMDDDQGVGATAQAS